MRGHDVPFQGCEAVAIRFAAAESAESAGFVEFGEFAALAHSFVVLA